MNAQSDLKVASSTQFCFEHRVFSVDGSYFDADEITNTPMFHLPMSGTIAAIDLTTLRDEFGILGESKDGRLLDVVKNSLRFVKTIRVNDDIPKELLDGSASWSVDDSHRRLAEGRVILQLVSWLTGGETMANDLSEMDKLVEDPATKKRLQEAMAAAAEAMGLPSGDAGKQQVVALVERISHEMSFVEGLREFYQRIRNMGRAVSYLQRRYARVATVREDLVRVTVLLTPVIDRLRSKFELVDDQTCEILAVLRYLDQQVKKIRQTRDDLHHEFMRWGELIDSWSFDPTSAPDEVIDKVVRDTYCFLARHYPQTVVWKR